MRILAQQHYQSWQKQKFTKQLAVHGQWETNLLGFAIMNKDYVFQLPEAENL